MRATACAIAYATTHAMVLQLNPTHMTRAIARAMTHATTQVKTYYKYHHPCNDACHDPPCHGVMARAKAHDMCHRSFHDTCHGPNQDM